MAYSSQARPSRSSRPGGTGTTPVTRSREPPPDSRDQQGRRTRSWTIRPSTGRSRRQRHEAARPLRTAIRCPSRRRRRGPCSTGTRPSLRRRARPISPRPGRCTWATASPTSRALTRSTKRSRRSSTKGSRWGVPEASTARVTRLRDPDGDLHRAVIARGTPTDLWCRERIPLRLRRVRDLGLHGRLAHGHRLQGGPLHRRPERDGRV